MLMDVLGIAIAFVTIILLLSIVVTAAVQASQAMLRLRGRNLLIGLAAAVLKERKGTAPSVSSAERASAKQDAMKVLNSRSLDPLSGAGIDASRIRSWFRYWITGPKVSWIDPEDLKSGLQDAGFDAAASERIQANFRRLEPHSCKRFQKVARGWSLVWAVIVAFSMQVSTPALLNKLTTNTEYRQRILANTDQDLAYAGEAIKRLDYETAAATALEELTKRHEALRGRIEQASGVGTNKRFIVEELREALDGVQDQDKIVQEYAKLLEDTASSEAQTTARETLGRLAAYDLRFWPAGLGFYYKEAKRITEKGGPDEPQRSGLVVVTSGGVEWQNLVGVLITVILLSLGAPYWYDRLRDLVGLRDQLGPKKPPKTEPKTSQ